MCFPPPGLSWASWENNVLFNLCYRIGWHSESRQNSRAVLEQFTRQREQPAPAAVAARSAAQSQRWIRPAVHIRTVWPFFCRDPISLPDISLAYNSFYGAAWWKRQLTPMLMVSDQQYHCNRPLFPFFFFFLKNSFALLAWTLRFVKPSTQQSWSTRNQPSQEVFPGASLLPSSVTLSLRRHLGTWGPSCCNSELQAFKQHFYQTPREKETCPQHC